ncbi:hypothetical protein V502_02251 [Pseudogymnoascus sp. VKM F-4520 (FW-2644)]|nr:hypothetical protein V502_02251 [Pseudogymnoascus sp. VKM F-4520 (FW-2644)]
MQYSHVRTVVEADTALGGELLATCTDLENLVSSFQKRFNSSNFFKVFVFVHQYINLDKSAPFRQYYCTELYAHLCAHGKLLVDWENTKGRAVEDPHSQAAFLKVMMKFLLSVHFDGLSKAEFFLAGQKTVMNKEKTVPKVSDLEIGVDCFFAVEMAPPLINAILPTSAPTSAPITAPTTAPTSAFLRPRTSTTAKPASRGAKGRHHKKKKH